MTTNMKSTQELLFGAGGLGASNIKMFPGFNRDATPEMIAADISAALEEVLSGHGEEFAFEEGDETVCA